MNFIKFTLIFTCIFLNQNIFSKVRLELSNDIFENSNLSKNFNDYLGMNINLSPVKAIRDQLISAGEPIHKNRDEAHITIIDPIDFAKFFKGVNSEELFEFVSSELQIQDSSFNILCVGSASNKKSQTFFLVVESEDLLIIRERVKERFASDSNFRPRAVNYYPHITIGFSKKDVHNVAKNRESCLSKYKIDLIN